MPSEQTDLLLEEPKGSSCFKKRSLACTLLWILVCLLIIALAVGLVFLLFDRTAKPPVVHVECGPVEGIYDSEHDVNIYKGIPYAAQPIGELRWRRPIPLTSDAEDATCWSGTLKATLSTACPQLDTLTNEFEGKEACLTLDVWTPGLQVSLLPVVVYIHGGGLMNFNSSVPGYSPDAQLTHNMQAVFVSINYRLGPLGFLVGKELGDDQTGNYGIWDQIEALKWIKANICNFGGDADQVTIMGQSSGGTSVKTLLVSPYAKGLFNRAWMMSGSARLTATFEDGMSSSSNQMLIRGTGCSNATCLRNLPYDTLAERYTVVPYSSLDLTKDLWSATFFDLIPKYGDLIPDSPEEIWKARTSNLSDVPILIGTTAQEMDSLWPEDSPNYTNELMLKDINESLSDFGSNLTEEVLAIYKFSSSLDPVYKMTTLSSDIYLTCGNNKIAGAASDALSSPVYRYIVTSFPSSSASIYHGPYDSHYAFHCWDSFSFFNGQNIYLKKNPQKSDLDFRHTMQNLAKDFITHGNISGWLKYPKSTAFIGRNVTFTSDVYHEKPCDFWKTKGLLAYEWSD